MQLNVSIKSYSLHQGLRKQVENPLLILFFLSNHCITERVYPSIFPCIHFWQNHYSREMYSVVPNRNVLKDYLWPEIHPFACLEPPLSPDMVYWSCKIEILKQGGKGHSHAFTANYWHGPGTRGSQSERSIWVWRCKDYFYHNFPSVDSRYCWRPGFNPDRQSLLKKSGLLQGHGRSNLMIYQDI